jgi:hypothetical protein
MAGLLGNLVVFESLGEVMLNRPHVSEKPKRDSGEDRSRTSWHAAR